MFVRPDPITLQDIFVLRFKEAAPAPILKTSFGEGAPTVSPDGRWLAYVSNESGHNEIYVTPFGRPGEKSTVSLDPVFSAGKPRRLFTNAYERSLALWPNYDVANDGQRFLMVKKIASGDAPMQINVVLNWIDELNRLLPPK